MRGDSAAVRAPGKLNLYLDITGRRSDGYHTLKTVMLAVSAANTVTVRAAGEGIRLRCDDPALPTGERNTAVRAARAFAAFTGLRPGWDITVQKGLPHQAGMGSASADAAGVLAALCALHGVPAGDIPMSAAVAVGADVPFMLRGGCALCEGVGDVITPLACPEGLWFLLVKGGAGFSTPEMYRRFDEQPPPPVPPADGLLRALAENRADLIAAALANRLEGCAPGDGVARAKARLITCGALGAAMTGSGSAVFGLFGSEAGAKAAEEKLRRLTREETGEAPWVAVARAVPHGPAVL